MCIYIYTHASISPDGPFEMIWMNLIIPDQHWDEIWSCRESLVTSRCSRFLCRGYVKPFDMKVTISEIIDGLVRCTKGEEVHIRLNGLLEI